MTIKKLLRQIAVAGLAAVMTLGAAVPVMANVRTYRNERGVERGNGNTLSRDEFVRRYGSARSETTNVISFNGNIYNIGEFWDTYSGRSFISNQTGQRVHTGVSRTWVRTLAFTAVESRQVDPGSAGQGPATQQPVVVQPSQPAQAPWPVIEVPTDIPEVDDFWLAQVEMYFLRILNNHRANSNRRNRSALTLNRNASQIAQERIDYLVENGFIRANAESREAHIFGTSDTSDYARRAGASGFNFYSGSIVASPYETARNVHNWNINSTTHQQREMSNAREVGIGLGPNGDGSRIYLYLFFIS